MKNYRNPKSFLVTGGAGYLGSHMVKLLREQGHKVVVLDNLSTGNVSFIEDCELINVDLTDIQSLSREIKNRNFAAVFHFAGKSIVAESINNPSDYFTNNVVGTTNLLTCMLDNKLNNLIFSSSASIFGNTSSHSINEDSVKDPVNPYGLSKLECERIIKKCCQTQDLKAVCLRYFNAAGAHSSGKLGELRNNETHLIPNLMKSLLLKNEPFEVFGGDYDTPDGTCVRDYVHVSDLVEAHLYSYEKLLNCGGYHEFNLGNEKGFSVLEIIKELELLLDKKINYKVCERRKGDPDYLIANSTKAHNELKWTTKMSNIKTIIMSAWKWHSYINKKR